jgi:uncharacterized membrane protein YfcA
VRAIDGAQHYRAKWEEYRHTRRANLLLLVAGVPGAMATSWLSAALGSDALGPLFAAVWLIAWAFTAFRLATWRCPRCAKHYFQDGFTSNVFARRCLHCRLAKWSVEA